MREGRVRLFRLALGEQVVGQVAPGFRMLWLQGHRAAQGRDGFLAPAQPAQREAQLELCGCPLRLRLSQRFEDVHLGRRAVDAPPRPRQDQLGRRMVRHHLEDFLGLLGGQRRVGLEQPPCVREGLFERAGGFCGGLGHLARSRLPVQGLMRLRTGPSSRSATSVS